MISARDKNEDHWKLLNRSNGDIYNGDNNSTIRLKFALHAIWCIPNSLTFRWGARALWVFSGMPLHNGYTMGKHRWQNIRMDQFYKNDRGALQNGKKEKLLHFFVIVGSMIEQTAKDGTKFLTYPAVIIAMEFIAIGGVFCPITAKRAQASVDHFAHMNNRHGETFHIGPDKPCVMQWKDFLLSDVMGAGYATPCMHPVQHLEETNGEGFGECENKRTKRHISNLLKTHHNYFTHNLCNIALKDTCEELAFYLSINATAKQFGLQGFTFADILSPLQDIIKTQNERSVGDSDETALPEAIKELQEQVNQLRTCYSNIDIDNVIEIANARLRVKNITTLLPVESVSWSKSLQDRNFDMARNKLYTAFEAARVMRDNPDL